MKWAHRLLGLLLGALLLVLIFRVLLPAFQGGETWSEFVTAISTGRIRVIIIALAMLAGLIAFVLTGLASGPRSHYLSYESDQGNISISLKALQDFLSHLKSDFPAILSLHPRVLARDEHLDITLEVRVKAGAPIPELSRMLQERARTLIQERIGISDIRDIEVKIEEIIREKESSVQPITPVAPPPAGDTP